ATQRRPCMAARRAECVPGSCGRGSSVLPLVAEADGHYTRGQSARESGPMIQLYIYVIIAGAVMSWLIAFNVVNLYNPLVRSIWQALNAVTEPLLRPIRRMMPDLGGVDISPVILILACWFVQQVVLPNIAKIVA